MTNANLVHIIDDDPGIRDSMQALLLTAGFDTRTYATARAFLDRIDSTGSCYVVLDATMPEMTGIELLEKINQFAGAHPVILMTGAGNIAVAARAMTAGAMDFLKPFGPDELIASVHGAMAATDGR